MISRDGTVGRRFTSDQCAICEFVVGSHFVRRVFLRVLRFPSHLKNQQFQFQFQLAFPFNIIVDKCLPVLCIHHLGYFNKFDDALLWVN